MSISGIINISQTRSALVMEKIQIKSVFFKKLKGLNNVKIEFTKPLTAIMGVNGSGKTTVIHALACIYQPDGNGENHKFPEFFIPNTDASWQGSEFTVVNEVEGRNKNRIIAPSKKYEKAFDRWNPRYDSRPKRNVYYIGIDSCMPEIEKSTATSRIGYSSNDRTDRISKKAVEIAAYILNKDYDVLVDNKYRKKHFLGVSTKSGLKYSSLSMGTGEQRTIKIIEKVLNAEPYSLILIDEIDLLLHVCALRRLIEKLNCLARDKHLQIVFTTHSLEMLDLKDCICLQYIDIQRKSDGTSNMLIYSSPNSDIIRNLTGQISKPINICVEDVYSQAIVKTLLRKYSISAKASIIKYGSATNAFSLIAGQHMSGTNLTNWLVILDGDKYTTADEKETQMKKAYSGTENDIEQRRSEALTCISQYKLPDNTAPEEFLYSLLIKCESDNEIVRTALSINAANDTHHLISHIKEQLQENMDTLISQIVSMVEHTEEWKVYISPVEDWIKSRIDI